MRVCACVCVCVYFFSKLVSMLAFILFVGLFHNPKGQTEEFLMLEHVKSLGLTLY